MFYHLCDADTSSQYNARIAVNQIVDAERKLIYEGSVVSIEDLANKKDVNANLKFWFVAYDALQPFFNIIQDKLSVPFQVKLSKF